MTLCLGIDGTVKRLRLLRVQITLPSSQRRASFAGVVHESSSAREIDQFLLGGIDRVVASLYRSQYSRFILLPHRRRSSWNGIFLRLEKEMRLPFAELSQSEDHGHAFVSIIEVGEICPAEPASCPPAPVADHAEVSVEPAQGL